MNVSIIIVNYNTKCLLEQCLASIIDKTQDVIYEIIVVDNASNDASCDMLKNLFPAVILIESNINLGFGRANNLAIENATGKYIFLLNSDTLLLNNAVLLFYNYMEAHNLTQSTGAIGGLLLDAEGKPTSSFDEFPTLRSEFGYIKRKVIEKLHKKTIINNLQLNDNSFLDVDYIIGADLFIPKSILEKIGVFDPQFFMYYEETDLQKRMANMGFRRLIIGGPKIIHLEGGSILSTSKFSYSRFILNQKSFHLYLRKYFRGVNYMIFRFFMIFIRSMIVFDRRLNFNEKVKAVILIISGRK